MGEDADAYVVFGIKGTAEGRDSGHRGKVLHLS